MTNKTVLWALAGFVAVILMTPSLVAAVINIDENGHGFEGPNGTQSFSGARVANGDPVFNPGAVVLVYTVNLLLSPGDVEIHDPGAVGDIVRFLPLVAGPGTSNIVFYSLSDNGDADLADVLALPAVRALNTPQFEIGMEGFNGVTYMPGMGAIGDDGTGMAMYNFFSDGMAAPGSDHFFQGGGVPEPGTGTLMPAALFLVLLCSRRRATVTLSRRIGACLGEGNRIREYSYPYVASVSPDNQLRARAPLQTLGSPNDFK